MVFGSGQNSDGKLSKQDWLRQRWSTWNKVRGVVACPGSGRFRAAEVSKSGWGKIRSGENELDSGWPLGFVKNTWGMCKTNTLNTKLSASITSFSCVNRTIPQ
jgi:hypothetical protein